MEMDIHTAAWFCCVVFLVLNKNFSNCNTYFKLTDSSLVATEGSCIEIKCELTKGVDVTDAYWFWMANASWIDNEKEFAATTVYSSNNRQRPVSPDFENRVRYNGSLPSSWKYQTRNAKLCSIVLCNLKMTDSGRYAFRFVKKESNKEFKWATDTVMLTVTENPCPIMFEKPPVVKESEMVTLTCSTLSSCPLSLRISGQTEPRQMLTQNNQTNETQKSTKATFQASWEDDGREFSCQTKDNKDNDLIRRVHLMVEYAPKNMQAKISPSVVKEGQSVTLICSAKGRPDPTFTWTKNGSVLSYEAKWKIQSVQDSQSGQYYCEARNKHGSTKSQQPVDIDVQFAPQVEAKMITSNVIQGKEMTLQCVVKRSNPRPYKFSWSRNRRSVGESLFYDRRMEPEDSGSYTCSATNTVGSGTSEPLLIQVQYGPRRTNISISDKDKKVKLHESLTLRCETDANPAPMRYYWYRYDGNEDTDWSPRELRGEARGSLRWERVQRTDEACYVCKATNSIKAGDSSKPKCIQVLYPPTNLVLSMETEVTAGQLVSISCTVESFPRSRLQLTKVSTEWRFSPPDDDERINALVYTFTAEPTHTGVYSCTATNDMDSQRSTQRKLVVKYPPKDVRVKAWPDLTVNENQWLALQCSAHSHPAVSSFTWVMVADGRNRTIQKTQNISLTSAGPSDSGLYSCSATNEVGTGSSQQAEVKVKYAPKAASIARAEEQRHPDGRRSVMLSCSSRSFPPIERYTWYRKMEGGERDVKVSDGQNYTVQSDRPGVYYCAAENEINQTLSEPVLLFELGGFMKHLKIFIFFLVILLIIIVFVFFFIRNRRNRSSQQGTPTTLTFASLGWRRCSSSSSRGAQREESDGGQPSRSRDDLLPKTHCPKTGQQHQSDSMPASNIHCEYSVIQPLRKQMQGEHRQDYENVKGTRVKNPSDSEEEIELNYSQVSFKVKPGHQTGFRRDSSSSDEDEIHYSVVKS